MQPPIRQIVEELRIIYEREAESAPHAAERYLSNLLSGCSRAEKREVLKQLAGEFKNPPDPDVFLSSETSGELLRFISLLLGKPVNAKDTGDNQLQERLYQSLTSIFNGLNELLLAINTTLNTSGNFDQTIRHVLGEQLENQTDSLSLEEYLGQIRQAFYISFESSKTAHRSIMEKVLTELAPEKLASKTGSSLKFGPLRKAEAFDIYSDTFQALRAWHDSGRGLEEYIRAFEKQCSEATLQNREERP